MDLFGNLDKLKEKWFSGNWKITNLESKLYTYRMEETISQEPQEITTKRRLLTLFLGKPIKREKTNL